MLNGHPVMIVGQSGSKLLGVEMTHSKNRGQSKNVKFIHNPNPSDKKDSYWEKWCIELKPEEVLDYSIWKLSSVDEAKLNEKLSTNSSMKTYFQ